MNRKWSIAILILSLAGLVWVQWNSHTSEGHILCFNQWLYHFPCPTCGITRSIIALKNGLWTTALYENPLGFPAFVALLLFPIWIIVDFVRGKSTFELFVRTVFRKLKIPTTYIPFFCLILLCWGWNIYKHLC